MKSRTRKESRILKDYKKSRNPSYSDRMFREEAKLYHKYLSKLSRHQDKEELNEELEEFYNEEGNDT